MNINEVLPKHILEFLRDKLSSGDDERKTINQNLGRMFTERGIYEVLMEETFTLSAANVCEKVILCSRHIIFEASV